VSDQESPQSPRLPEDQVMPDPTSAVGPPEEPASAEGGMSRRRFLLMSTAAAGGLVVGGLAVAGCTDDGEGDSGTTDGTGTESTEAAAEIDHGVNGEAATLALTALTIGEAEALQAMLARLIPSDEVGPGAVEAGVVRYIDRALSSELAPTMQTVRYNIGRLDEFVREQQQDDISFNQLNPDVQDQILASIEGDEAEGFSPSSAAFFATIRELAMQGMFGDPFYGGNIGNAGWDLIGFPGIRLLVEADDQELGNEQAQGRNSVYDFEMFGIARQEES